MKSRKAIKTPGGRAAKPTEKQPVPQERSPTEHAKVFDQLLDDAIFGVKKKKKK